MSWKESLSRNLFPILLCPSLFGEVKRVVNLKTGSVSTQTWLEKVD